MKREEKKELGEKNGMHLKCVKIVKYVCEVVMLMLLFSNVGGNIN